jgi:hypothetical protein
MRYKSLPLSVRGTSHPIAPPPVPPRRGRARLADWIATIPVLLLVPALLLAGAWTIAFSTSLRVTGEPFPGSTVVVTGQEFPAGASGQLRWDGSNDGMPDFRVNGQGRFKIRMVIPAEAAPGPHSLTGVATASAKRSGGSGSEMSVTVTIEVLDPTPATPTAAPTAPPVVTPEPTTAPPAPTATPTPADIPPPTSSPTIAPTVAPTASAVPEPGSSASPAPTAMPTATLAPTAPPVGDPRLTCVGYAEPRVFLEAQTWWDPDPVYGGSSHVHVGTCFPYAATLAGVVHFDVRVLLHSNSCLLTRVKLENDDPRGEDYDVILSDNYVSFQGDGSNTQVLWVPMDADTTRWSDGLKSFQFYTFCRHPGGNEMRVLTDWTATTANGNPVVNEHSAQRIDAQGWYTDASYAQPGLRSPYTFEQLVTPKSGTWTFNVRLSGNTDPGPVLSHMITVDPDFHGGHEGHVIAHGTGSYSGSITIDTREFADGTHKLVLITQKANQAGDGLNTGVQVVTFRVDN